MRSFFMYLPAFTFFFFIFAIEYDLL